MKTIKYITLGILIIILSFNSLSTLRGQEGSLRFVETYSVNEITSSLDPEDKFFQLIEINQRDPGSSKIGTCTLKQSDVVWSYIHSKDFLRQLPEDLRFAWGAEQDDQQQSLYALKQSVNVEAKLDHTDILEAAVIQDNLGNSYSLQITFSEEGTERWARLTGNNVGRAIAIVLEGKVYSAPRVNEPIKHGKCVISGNFNETDILQFKELFARSRD